MKVIGLTGGVGSGKTTVANILQSKFNACLINTDDIAKKLMKPGEISYQLVVEHFGREILDETGEINRPKLANIVFSNPNELAILNSFSHPYVKEYVLHTIEQEKKINRYSFLVVETALLIEAGYERYCDEVWYVTVSDAIRRKRLKENRGYTDQKIDSIMKNQLKEETFVAHANKIIVNEEAIDKILPKLHEMVENL